MQQAGRRLAKIEYAQCLGRILDDYAYVRRRRGSPAGSDGQSSRDIAVAGNRGDLALAFGLC
jgi:hypothetical protein